MSKKVNYVIVIILLLILMAIFLKLFNISSQSDCEEILDEYPQSIQFELLDSYGSCQNPELIAIVSSHSKNEVIHKVEALVKQREDSFQSLENTQSN